MIVPWHLQLHSQNNSLTSLLPLPSRLFFCPALAFHLCSLKMWMYSNEDLCNHPAIISIFWMCSHLGFFLYILSFHSLRSRRLKVVSTRKKWCGRGRHARVRRLSFEVLCVWVSIRFQFILPLFFRKRKPGITQPFYLYTIHEHSKIFMIHELRAFVDRVKCLKVTTDTNFLDLECSSVLKKNTLQPVLT